MALSRKIAYPSSDGIHTVHGREWLPQGEPRGVLQLVHGVAEHVGRYGHVAQFFCRHGLVVCGEDHLGHGLTAREGELGFFASKGGWDLLVEDIRRLRELEGEKYPGIPYVMLGHSMGSFLTRTYLIRCPGTLDGAVLSGTGQENGMLVAGGKAAANVLCALLGPKYVSRLIYHISLGSYNRKFRPGRGQGSWLSRDEEWLSQGRDDPLTSFKPTVSMFRDMLGGIQEIGKLSNLERMDKDTPIYFFSGDQDPVGAEGRGVRKVETLFRRAGCRDVTVRLYPGGRHEMLNETNRQQVMEELLAWLEEKVLSPGTGGNLLREERE